eukprot:TRINITY_DN24729_c0_g1_i1.p1 TRINITY_DN24729_c0_g1~~TRINITY_DN24729_c0_g1_i1.p1  ORF type:complete len:413 (+),score=91.54 TRINITY_DN24729_c0_g1_i1:306-1544(+)
MARIKNALRQKEAALDQADQEVKRLWATCDGTSAPQERKINVLATECPGLVECSSLLDDRLQGMLAARDLKIKALVEASRAAEQLVALAREETTAGVQPLPETSTMRRECPDLANGMACLEGCMGDLMTRLDVASRSGAEKEKALAQVTQEAMILTGLAKGGTRQEAKQIDQVEKEYPRLGQWLHQLDASVAELHADLQAASATSSADKQLIHDLESTLEETIGEAGRLAVIAGGGQPRHPRRMLLVQKHSPRLAEMLDELDKRVAKLLGMIKSRGSQLQVKDAALEQALGETKRLLTVATEDGMPARRELHHLARECPGLVECSSLLDDRLQGMLAARDLKIKALVEASRAAEQLVALAREETTAGVQPLPETSTMRRECPDLANGMACLEGCMGDLMTRLDVASRSGAEK